MARVVTSFGRDELKTAYSIQFVAFSGEEQGLLGSRAYAPHLSKQDPNRVVAMANCDMLGWTLPGEKMRLGMKDRYVAEWLLSVADLVTETYVPSLPVGRSPSCCSDHQAFFEAGFPAVGYFENVGNASSYPHYHQQTDLPEYLNYEQCGLITKAVLGLVLTMGDVAE